MVPPPLPLSSAQFTTPFALTVSFPLLVKLVQLRVVRVRPPELWMPLANVDVAVVLVALMTGTLIAVYMVEVPELTKFAAPWMERREPGVVVPMPTRPDCMTLKSWPWAPMNRVEVAMSADEVVVPVICALPACTERREPGEEEPMPRVLLISS